MKKIIVPVDFSVYSENALRTAAFFARKYESEIVLVHMLELSSAVLNQSESDINKQAFFGLKVAEKEFNSLLEKPYLEEVKVTAIVKKFKIFSELKSIAKEIDADLIIMGSHGAAGLKEAFVGSNTEKVVRTSEVPVLVVKGLPIASSFKNAVFACDFSQDDIVPYQKAKALLAILEVRMDVLYVDTPNTKFRSTSEKEDRVSKFLMEAEGDLGLLDEVIYVTDYSVEEGILNYTQKADIDLIVMATHGRTGLEHFFTGSISEDVANHADKPVLTIKM